MNNHNYIAEEEKDELKKYLKDYCDTNLEKRKENKYRYNCPFCRSGTGKNKTAGFNINKKTNFTTYTCFACNPINTGDIFDLIGKVDNLNNFIDQVNRARELYNTSYISKNQGNTSMKSKGGNSKKIAENNYIALKELLPNTVEAYKNEKSKKELESRGINEETAQRFDLRFYVKNNSLIIPISDLSYNERKFTTDSNQKWRMRGRKSLFNAKILQNLNENEFYFVVESELDCITLEALGYKAVATAGTGCYTFLIDYIKNNTVKGNAIVWGDNDSAGKKMEENIENNLKEINMFCYIVPDELKKIKDIGEFIQQKKVDESKENIKEVIVKATEKLKNYGQLKDSETEEKINKIDSYKAKENLYKMQHKIMQGNETRIQTGFNSLDGLIGEDGLYNGLYIIGAVSGLGKTTYTLQLADQISAIGQKVLFYSLEMSAEELISKSISRLTEQLNKEKHTNFIVSSGGLLNYNKLKNTPKEHMDYIEECFDYYEKNIGENLYIKEGVGDIGVSEIEQDIKDFINYKEAKPVIIIDYIQLLSDPHEKKSVTEKQIVDKNVLELKRLSRKYEIVVWGISSFNRASYREKLDLSAFKESGAIEYGADVLMGLNFTDLESELEVEKTKDKVELYAGEGEGNENHREITLCIMKNRKGKAFQRIKYNYYPIYNYFKELF